MVSISNKLIISVLSSLFIIGCDHNRSDSVNETKDMAFKCQKTLAADSVEMDVIIKPGNIYWSDPYIVVSDVASNKTRHFAVFDRDLKFLYTFAGVGMGAEECLMPTFVKNMPNGEFLVRDHSTNDFLMYELSDTAARFIKRFKVSTGDSDFLWELNHVSDGRLMTKAVAPRRVSRRLLDSATGAVVDSLPPTFDLAGTMGKDYYSEFDDFWLCVNADNFACAYYFIDRIEFGKVKSDSLDIRCSVGADTPPDFHLYTDEVLEGKYEYNVDYNIVYYEWAFSTKNRFYASYFGEPWGDINKHSSAIESYSWTGEPENRYKLNKPVASFIVLEPENKIIGINPELSDDLFYLYGTDK